MSNVKIPDGQIDHCQWNAYFAVVDNCFRFEGAPNSLSRSFLGIEERLKFSILKVEFYTSVIHRKFKLSLRY